MSWKSIVDALPGVRLEELNRTAELLTRIDRKYVISPEAFDDVLASQGGGLRALEIDGRRAASYHSVYYDTQELTSYLAAARQRPHRFKVRTRHYVDTGVAAVEVKLRSARGDTVKHRMWLDHEIGRGPESPAVAAYAASFPEVAPFADRLLPSLTTTYSRTTLLAPTGRITIDAGVEAEDARGSRCCYDGYLIVETKSLGGAAPIDHDLWEKGFRPVRLSKYATSLAALHPELPANRWHRTLTRNTPSGRVVAAA